MKTRITFDENEIWELIICVEIQLNELESVLERVEKNLDTEPCRDLKEQTEFYRRIKRKLDKAMLRCA